MFKGIPKLSEIISTTEEWHNFVIGFCTPACKIWRVKTIYYDLKERHYFMAGVLISTIALFIAIGAFIVLIIRIT